MSDGGDDGGGGDNDYVFDDGGVDTVTETTYNSYGGRLCNSLKGMCLAPVLVLGAVLILIWNEGNAVASHRALTEASQLVVELDSDSYNDNGNDESYSGRLVHTSGKAETEDQLMDEDFGVVPSTYVLKLKRVVEQYQWIEESETHTKKHNGGSTTKHTTYRYYKEWREDVVDSSWFHDSADHQNPGYFAYESQYYVADPVTLEGYTLSSSALDEINWFTTVSGSSLDVDNIQVDNAQGTAEVITGGFYVPGNGNNNGNGDGGYSSYSSPSVGDYRITFLEVQPQTISIIASPVDGTFYGYETSQGRTVLLVEQGSVSAVLMFRHAQNNVTIQAWIVRLIGTVIMYIGFLLASDLIGTLADVFPPLGDLVGGTMACLSFLIALGLSSTVIALSWIAYRPLYAVPMLLLIIGCLIILCRRRQQQHVKPDLYETATAMEQPIYTATGSTTANTTQPPPNAANTYNSSPAANSSTMFGHHPQQAGQYYSNPSPPEADAEIIVPPSSSHLYNRPPPSAPYSNPPPTVPSSHQQAAANNQIPIVYGEPV